MRSRDDGTERRRRSRGRNRYRFHRNSNARGGHRHGPGQILVGLSGAAVGILSPVAALATVWAADGLVRGWSLAITGLLVVGTVWGSAVVVAHVGAVLVGRVSNGN